MMMQGAILELRKTVDAICPLSADEWLAFSAVWKPVSFPKKSLVTRAGEREKYLYFIVSGVQRIYYFDESEREATLLFTYPPSFGGILDAFMLQKSAAYSYETLTASSFLRSSYPEIRKLCDEYPAVERMMQTGVTMALSGVLERLVELQCFSSEEKFRSLLQRSPHILNLFPQKYLANYLGIDPTNFSKLINKVRI